MIRYLTQAVAVLRSEGALSLFAKALDFIRNRIPPRHRSTLVEYYYRLHGHTGLGNPLRVYFVDPNNIDYSIHSGRLDWSTPIFGIRDGDWDANARKLTRNGMYHQHFRDGIPWESTDKYEVHVQKIRERGTHGHLDLPDNEHSIEKFHEYLGYMDELYDNIKTNGYKTQQELAAGDDFAGRTVCPPLNEIQLFVGRDGKLIVRSGRHRLYMAQILQLDRVPVRTQVRHSDWQKIRNEIVNSNDYSELSDVSQNNLSHPELSDIVPKTWLEQHQSKN